METIKKIFGALPPVAWLIIAVVLIVGFWWFSNDIGTWWEHRNQAKFDQTQQQQQQQIDDLVKQRDAALQRAAAAEAKEQVEATEADTLKQQIAKYGADAKKAQEKIDEAANNYKQDTDIINKAANGEITKFQLCQMQCDESAKEGYPCRANYCDTYKGR